MADEGSSSDSSPSRSSLQNWVPNPSLSICILSTVFPTTTATTKRASPLGYCAGAEQQQKLLQKEKAHDRSRRLKGRPRETQYSDGNKIVVDSLVASVIIQTFTPVLSLYAESRRQPC